MNIPFTPWKIEVGRQEPAVDPWKDSSELLRRRVVGEPIPPVPATSLLDMPPSVPTC